MDDEEQPGRSFTSKAGALFIILLLPFLPLILAFVEQFVLGTDHVEGLCREVGIHDELSFIYEPIIRLFF